MSEYMLFGERVTFSDAMMRYSELRYSAATALDIASKTFKSWYASCSDIETVLRSYTAEAVSLANALSCDCLFDDLPEMEIFDVSKDTYNDACFDVTQIETAYNFVAEAYNLIIEDQDAQIEYRAARKAGRGRVVGGGFGVGGAIKGMATAGAINAVTGAGHSLVNAVGNVGSSISASKAKKELYKNDDTDTGYA